jgi:hypothetical protein
MGDSLSPFQHSGLEGDKFTDFVGDVLLVFIQHSVFLGLALDERPHQIADRLGAVELSKSGSLYYWQGKRKKNVAMRC